MAEDKWHGFTVEAIGENAPRDPGVYRIDNMPSAIYVGESKSIQERLLEHCRHISDQSECIYSRGPKFFLYNIVRDRKTRLITEALWRARLNPPCNQQ